MRPLKSVSTPGMEIKGLEDHVQLIEVTIRTETTYNREHPNAGPTLASESAQMSIVAALGFGVTGAALLQCLWSYAGGVWQCLTAEIHHAGMPLFSAEFTRRYGIVSEPAGRN